MQELRDAVRSDVIRVLFCIIPGKRSPKIKEAHSQHSGGESAVRDEFGVE